MLQLHPCQIPILVYIYWYGNQQRGKFSFSIYCMHACILSIQVVVGVVYNFILDQLFAAKKGGGATMNGEPIHVSQCTG